MIFNTPHTQALLPLGTATLVKRISTYLVKALALGFLLLLLLFCTLSAYVSIHKKELLAKATNTLQQRVSGKVHIADLSVSLLNNFPFLSIKLKKVSVVDSLYAIHQHKLFSADYVFLRFNPLGILSQSLVVNKVEIRNGNLYLHTDTTGYSNQYLMQFKEPVSPNEQLKMDLKHMTLTNVDLILDDRLLQKYYSFTIQKLRLETESSEGSQVTSWVHSRAVIHPPSKNSNNPKHPSPLVDGQYTLLYEKQTGRLWFTDINASHAGNPIRLTGRYAPEEALAALVQRVPLPIQPSIKK